MVKTIYTKGHRQITKQLKKARIESGLDQEKVAKLLGKSQPYVSKVESGQRRIDIIQLKEFSRIYRKKLSFFIK